VWNILRDGKFLGHGKKGGIMEAGFAFQLEFICA
jgi:hypothetical protein